VRSTLASRRGVDLDEIVIDRTCRYCGDLEHGKPSSAVTPTLWWSLSRSDALSALAWSDQCDVGLDIASSDEPTPLGSAVNWVAAEAALKLVGRGLADDPRTVGLSPGIVEVPGHPTVFLQEIVLPNSVGAVATMVPVTVVLHEVDQRSGVLF
jgi:phosphopantetheinyl transferase